MKLIWVLVPGIVLSLTSFSQAQTLTTQPITPQIETEMNQVRVKAFTYYTIEHLSRQPLTTSVPSGIDGVIFQQRYTKELLRQHNTLDLQVTRIKDQDLLATSKSLGKVLEVRLELMNKLRQRYERYVADIRSEYSAYQLKLGLTGLGLIFKAGSNEGITTNDVLTGVQISEEARRKLNANQREILEQYEADAKNIVIQGQAKIDQEQKLFTGVFTMSINIFRNEVAKYRKYDANMVLDLAQAPHREAINPYRRIDMAIIEINKAQSDADYAKIGELAKELSNVAPLGTITSHHPRFLDNYFYILNYTAAQLACDAAYQASKESFPKSSTDISKQGLLAGTLANKADGHRMKIQLEQSPEFVQTVVRSRALSGNAKSAATYLSDYYAKKAGAGGIDDPTISDYRFWYDAAKIYALCRSNVDYSRSMDCLLIAHRLGLSQDEKRIENVKICPELKPVRDSKTASVVRRQSGFFIYNTVATSTSAAFRELFP